MKTNPETLEVLIALARFVKKEGREYRFQRNTLRDVVGNRQHEQLMVFRHGYLTAKIAFQIAKGAAGRNKK